MVASHILKTCIVNIESVIMDKPCNISVSLYQLKSTASSNVNWKITKGLASNNFDSPKIQSGMIRSDEQVKLHILSIKRQHTLFT